MRMMWPAIRARPNCGSPISRFWESHPYWTCRFFLVAGWPGSSVMNASGRHMSGPMRKRSLPRPSGIW